MYTQENSKPPLRELDRRAGNGVVRLLWSAPTRRVFVAVEDTRAGDWFQVEVEGTEALAASWHPYAYAPPEAKVTRIEQGRPERDRYPRPVSGRT